MQFVACFLLSALALVAQQQAAAPAETKPEDLCTVEGQVRNSATGEPIRKAEISLRGAERPAGGAGTRMDYSAVADAGGKFAIKDAEPGKYRLFVHRTGFVDTQYGARGPGRGGAVISLQKAGRLKDLVVQLIPQAVIAGKVVDEKNEPAASVRVSARRYSYLGGKKELLDAGSATSNDLGEYRIYGLAPGRYYLVAAHADDDYAASLDRSAIPALESYVPTYYPGAADPDAAVPLEVGAGVQLRGTNLTLAKARTFRVRGRVAGQHNVNLRFFPRGESAWASMSMGHMADAQGAFEIRNVEPGGYTLLATAWIDGKTYSARQDVDVGEDNVDNLALTVEPGIEIKGRVETEGQATPDLNSVVVSLRDETGEFSAGSRVSNDAFTFDSVALASYRIGVLLLPDGYWVKSVKMGEQEVKESGIDLTRGPAGPITVTIAPKAWLISGTVLNEKQQPAAGATVVLVPEPRLRGREEAYKTTATDQYGSFTVKNIAPGEYKLFAWEDVEYGEYLDPEFLKPVEDRGQSFSIQEGSRETVQLNVIPADSAAKTRSQ